MPLRGDGDSEVRITSPAAWIGFNATTGGWRLEVARIHADKRNGFNATTGGWRQQEYWLCLPQLLKFQCHYGGMETKPKRPATALLPCFNATTGGWRHSATSIVSLAIQVSMPLRGDGDGPAPVVSARRVRVSMPLRGDGDSVVNAAHRVRHSFQCHYGGMETSQRSHAFSVLSSVSMPLRGDGD